MTTPALILFAHGARSPGWAAPFERMRMLTQERMPGVTVALGFLELMTPKLPELVAQLLQDGVDRITVVPVFLGQGAHVLRDLPLIVEQLQRDHPGLIIDVAQAAGEDPAVLGAIADYCVAQVRQPAPI